MKTTKAKRKVAQRKPKQQAAAKPKRSFLALFGFILLGVIIGMVAIQAVESRWLRSDVAAGTFGKETCGPKATSVNDCAGCCANAITDAVEKKICEISCKTAYNNNLSNADGNAAQQKAAEEVQTATEADFAQTYMSGTSAATTTSTASAAKPTTTASGTVYPSKAECEKAGCKSCVLKTAASGSAAASSSGGGTTSGDVNPTTSKAKADPGPAGKTCAENMAEEGRTACKPCCEKVSIDTNFIDACVGSCNDNWPTE